MIVALLVMSLALCGIALYVAIFQHHTKARFAFAALGAVSSLSILIVGSLLARQTPIQGLIALIAQMRGLPYTPQPPSSIELVVICLVTFSLHSTVKSIYQNWHGPLTVEERQKEVQQEATSLLVEGVREGFRLLRRLPSSPLYVPPSPQQHFAELTPPQDTAAWHQNARELVVLRHPTLDFPQADGWHEQENCWVGRNTRTGQAVVLACTVEKPTSEQIQRLASYIVHTVGVPSSQRTRHFWLFRGDDASWEANIDGVAVCCESEGCILDHLVDFGDYFFDIVRRVEGDCLPESELCLKDVYVESVCGEKPLPDEQTPLPAEHLLREWSDDASSRHLALLGEYGQGKSTCVLMFAYKEIRQGNFRKRRFPVLIELRGKAPSTMSPDELLATWAVRFRINPVALKRLLIAGKVLLMFDGFDEMAFIGQGETRVEHFRTLWQLAYPRAKILITGRPNFFLDDAEMRAALGIREAVPGRPYCHAVYLRPFTIPQIASALRAFKPEVQREIPALAERNARFRDLAARPCLLYIIGVLWEKRRQQLSQSMTSASVMDLFVNYSLDRQEAKARSGCRFMTLQSPERAFFMEGIAIHMLANHLPNQILLRDLRGVTTQLLAIIPDSVTAMDGAMAANASKPLRKRIGEEESLHEALQTDVRTYGLLVNDPTKAGTMRFAHKSFMEYLAARVVARGIVSPGDDPSAALRNSFGVRIRDITANRETAAFFAESIASTLSSSKDHDEVSLARLLLRILVPSFLVRRLLIPVTLRVQVLCRLSQASYLRRRMEDVVTSDPSIVRDEIKRFVDMAQVLKEIPLRSVRLYRTLIVPLFWPVILLTPFSPVILRGNQEGWRAWLDCCFELGISSKAMAATTSSDLVPFFEFEAQMYRTGGPLCSVFQHARMPLFRFIPLFLR